MEKAKYDAEKRRNEKLLKASLVSVSIGVLANVFLSPVIAFSLGLVAGDIYSYYSDYLKPNTISSSKKNVLYDHLKALASKEYSKHVGTAYTPDYAFMRKIGINLLDNEGYLEESYDHIRYCDKTILDSIQVIDKLRNSIKGKLIRFKLEWTAIPALISTGLEPEVFADWIESGDLNGKYPGVNKKYELVVVDFILAFKDASIINLSVPSTANELWLEVAKLNELSLQARIDSPSLPMFHDADDIAVRFRENYAHYDPEFLHRSIRKMRRYQYQKYPHNWAFSFLDSVYNIHKKNKFFPLEIFYDVDKNGQMTVNIDTTKGFA